MTDKRELVDPSNYGAYDTAYTPSPYGAPTDRGAPPEYYTPDYSTTQGQEMFSNASQTTRVVVAPNEMFRQASVPMPPNYIVHNVLVLLFCSLIFGIIGIVKGNQVSTLYLSGNYAAAEAASLDARKWYRVGLGFGCFVKAFLIAFLVVYAFI